MSKVGQTGWTNTQGLRDVPALTLQAVQNIV